MAGYEDTRQKIISALMGRPVGTEIQPENHQDYALNMLDYIRSLELIATSTLIGIADENTTPVQPNNSRVCYIAGVSHNQTVTFQNFIDENGTPISVTTGDMEGVFVILLWNTQYWSAQTFSTNIISQSESATFYYRYNIRKTYESIVLMNTDVASPIGTDGKYIKVGDIVTVVNSTTPSENGFYSYEGSELGWRFQSGFNFQISSILGNDNNLGISQKKFTDERLNNILSRIIIRPGNNLLNRNYVEPSNPYEYERGGADRLINPTTGVVIDYPRWYISPLIDWQDKTQAIIYNCRCWAQYAEDGVTLKGIYYPGTAQSGNILINKATDAKYIRVGLVNLAGNHMMNFGNVLLPFEPYKEIVGVRYLGNTPIFFNAIKDEVAIFKEMLLSESYIPQSPTYTDGVVNSPINVIWADGDSGVLTLTRNSDGLVTKIVATKIHSGITLTLTENITRDSDGNATNITIA